MYGHFVANDLMFEVWHALSLLTHGDVDDSIPLSQLRLNVDHSEPPVDAVVQLLVNLDLV